MRVMVIVKEDPNQSGPPPTELLEAMGNYNMELVKAGVMVDGAGLLPSAKGKRVRFGDAGETSVIDGPFSESKELVGGFWMWEVADMDDAVAWLRKAPMQGCDVELRIVAQAEDFGDAMTDEIREQEERIREIAEANQR